MELEYYDLGAWGDEFDGDNWTYEIDYDQMEDFFIDWNLDNFEQEKRKQGIELTKEEEKLARQLLRSVARNNDGYVEKLCEELEDEVKEYFREEAQEDMDNYNYQKASDELEYQKWRAKQH